MIRNGNSGVEVERLIACPIIDQQQGRDVMGKLLKCLESLKAQPQSSPKKNTD